MRSILLLAPGYEHSDGGIQAYSKEIESALEGEFHVSQVDGRGRSRISFTLEALRAAVTCRPVMIMTTHLHYAPVAMMAALPLGVPYAVSLHGVEAWNIRGALRRLAVRRADVLLPVSEFTEARARLSMDGKFRALQILPNTFDSNRFSHGPKPIYLLKRYGLEIDQPVILTVGRLDSDERYKGHDEVLAVLKGLQHDFPRIRYLIVGDGSDAPRLKGVAERNNVLSSTIFAGRVSEEELPDHYRLSDLFVMPSSGEGFGIAYLEALGCGRRIVTGQDAGSEITEDEDFGVTVNPSDINSLHAAISALLSTSSDPEKIHARVTAKFGRPMFKRQLLKVLSSL